MPGLVSTVNRRKRLRHVVNLWSNVFQIVLIVQHPIVESRSSENDSIESEIRLSDSLRSLLVMEGTRLKKIFLSAVRLRLASQANHLAKSLGAYASLK